MGHLIDSSVFIALERAGQLLSVLTGAIPPGPVALASITVSELLVGAHRALEQGRRLEREAFVDALPDAFPVLAFDLRCARGHARLGAGLQAGGRLVGAHNLLIGATAIAHDHAVVTLNVRDFERIPGLEIIQPSL